MTKECENRVAKSLAKEHPEFIVERKGKRYFDIRAFMLSRGHIKKV
jgi:hypothetical protein